PSRVFPLRTAIQGDGGAGGRGPGDHPRLPSMELSRPPGLNLGQGRCRLTRKWTAAARGLPGACGDAGNAEHARRMIEMLSPVGVLERTSRSLALPGPQPSLESIAAQALRRA